MNHRRLVVSLLLTLSLLPMAHGLEWPVAEIHLQRLFGQRSEGRMEQGLVLGKAGVVRAADNGKILITLEQNGNMNGFPGTLGNAVIVKHDDDLLTVYGNLDSIERVDEQSHVDSGNILGNAGTSGWTDEGSFIFQVIDQAKKTVLNPLLLLPLLNEKRDPSIRNVVAVSPSGQTYALGSVRSIRQGKYKLYADVADTVDKSGHELSPFRVTVILNGGEYRSVPFELIKADRGNLYLGSPEYRANILYGDPERMYLGEVILTRGKNDLVIIAYDTAGNEKSTLFGLQTE